jgi:hypothetical protein
MTTSREVKKVLTAYFKALGEKIKFSCTTGRVSCSDVIKVQWAGEPCEDEVWEVVKGFHTLQDKSDMMTDYFHRTGVEIRLERWMDEADREFIETYVVPELPQGYTLEFDNWTQSYYVKHDGYHVYTGDEVYQSLKSYSKTGAIAGANIERKLERATAQPVAPRPQPEPELLPGEEVDTKKTYITIHWAEGLQIYKECAQFQTFKTAHDAITDIYLANRESVLDGGYIKLKFTVHYPDGETYTGRLDMSPREDDPTTTDNILKKHCMEFLDWQVSQGETTQLEVDKWVAQHGFSDRQDGELIKLLEELAGVVEQIKQYLDIQLDLLYNFEALPDVDIRMKSLDEEFGIELLKRRKAKLESRLKEIM